MRIRVVARPGEVNSPAMLPALAKAFQNHAPDLAAALEKAAVEAPEAASPRPVRHAGVAANVDALGALYRQQLRSMLRDIDAALDEEAAAK